MGIKILKLLMAIELIRDTVKSRRSDIEILRDMSPKHPTVARWEEDCSALEEAIKVLEEHIKEVKKVVKKIKS